MKPNCTIYSLISFIPLLFSYITAQPPHIEWQRTFGGIASDIGLSVIQTRDKGYTAIGSSKSYIPNVWNAYAIRVDSVGSAQWEQYHGGYSGIRGYGVLETTDSCFLLVGHTRTTPPDYSYLIKFDNFGDTLWTKEYRGRLYGVKSCLDTSYILGGSIWAPWYNMYAIKTDFTGDTLWTKQYGRTNYDNRGMDIVQTNDGGFAIAGYDYYSINLLKANESGDSLWLKKYGGAARDRGYALQQCSDFGFVVTGFTRSFGAGMEDVYLIRTDSGGDTLWTRTYGGPDVDIGYSIDLTNDGGYIIAGVTLSYGPGSWDVYLIKTDSNGDTIWTQTYGGPYGDGAYSVKQTSDGGYIITGYTDTLGPGFYDVWLIKTNPFSLLSPNGGETFFSGDTISIDWFCEKFPLTEHSFQLLFSSDGGNNYSDTIASDISQDSTTWQWVVHQVFSTTCRVKIQAFDSLNNLLEEDESNNNFTITLVDLAIPNGGEMWLWDSTYIIEWQKGAYFALPYYFNILLSVDSGQTYSDTIAVNVSSDSASWNWTIPHIYSLACKVKIQAYDTLVNLLSEDESDSVFSIAETGIEETETPLRFKVKPIKVYPCPFADKINIEYSTENITKESEIRIYDISGRLIRVLILIPDKPLTMWDGRDDAGNIMPPGIYFLKLTAGEHEETKKLIKIR